MYLSGMVVGVAIGVVVGGYLDVRVCQRLLCCQQIPTPKNKIGGTFNESTKTGSKF